MKIKNVFVELRIVRIWEGQFSLGFYTAQAYGPDDEIYKSFNIGIFLLELGFYR